MKVDFWNSYYFNEIYYMVVGENAIDVKGIYIPNDDSILINTGALQWKGLKEEELIKEISKTVVHETIHFIIRKESLWDVDYEYGEGEERMCEMLSGQSSILQKTKSI